MKTTFSTWTCERAKQICDLVIASGLNLGFQFGNGVRLERFDEELMQKLALAGTHHMAIAIESASDRDAEADPQEPETWTD